ncbi:threonine-phosphate decarboxylase CobD [Shimwellia blattae]|uniref:threonine-phosphate decarboxylase n=2 Tax=Shimwellia blattae TaxID=563 RepID=I2BB93_SHIBC|nr:threonine-phosphate decarboxylase CobD [Shimwellia blattae]AAW65978.1 putative aminotransferase [Shimwellia blattae DSM 4481 = NBRC 105725]AFJ47797.1 putative aminotransferase in cobalamin synthesis [Shimwellia blattae DSM 4481 = NBRC 105725]VDY65298.1 Threonine-phosphate decarboxylase [Shimwellia blattae]VEC24163.1 Threonine-phosphate decarboxylase [Shimwellia blattae]GAB79627.1 histidinol-phosphate aminotransferase [Shimwellia blattae DSM 4481 = NBRC 105725]
MALLTSLHGGNIREAARWSGLEPGEILDFSANINPLGMPDSLRAAMIGNLALAERYPDVEYQALHQALAAHHRVDVRQVMAGNGETELIFSLAEFLAPQQALVVIPGFAEYRRALGRSGCQVSEHVLREEEGWQLTGRILDELHSGLDCLFLCTPNNPTGLLPDPGLMMEIARRCAELHIALVVDEAFLDFVPTAPGMIPHLMSMPHVWVLRSLTKFFAIPGLRLGYLIGGDLAAVATMRQRQQPWTINAFAALAGEVILRDRAYHQATFNWLNSARPALYQGLAALPGLRAWPGVANYVFFRCEVAGLNLQEALLRRGILIRHCANYPGLDSRYYRVAVKSAADNQQLLAALRQVLSDTAPGQ